MLISAALLAVSVATGALAAGKTVSPDSVASVSVLPGWRTPQGTHMTALRIRLADGWKTYWRAPGDTGIPPRFDWNGSDNLAGVAFHWPTPDVFMANGVRAVGYKHELILPIELTPKVPGKPIVLQADVELGVCSDICMPMAVHLSADLAPAGQGDPRISAALARRPFDAAEAGVSTARCSVEPIRDGLRITATLSMPSLGPGEVAVFEHADQRIWVAEATASRSGGTLTAVTEMVPPSGQPFSLDRSQVRITVLGGGSAVDIDGCTG